MSSERKNRHHQAAQKFLNRGQKKRAIVELEKALALDTADIRTRLRIAELYLRDGNAEKSVDGFIQCARHYEDLGSVNKALTVYEQVLEILPDRVELYVAMADLEIKTGQKEAAMGRYRVALRVLDELGDPSSKLDVIRCMLELEPANIGARVRLAESFIAAGREDDGVEVYRQVVDALASNSEGSGSAHVRTFQNVAERYLYHQPDDAQLAKKLAITYIQTDESARALPKLRLAYRQTPHDLELLGVIAQAFDELGQSQKSVAVYKEMARLFERSGLEEERDHCYRNILRLNPTDRSIRAQLGDLKSDVSGQTIQFESGPVRAPTPTAEGPPPDSVFGPPPVPDEVLEDLAPLLAFEPDEVDLGFEDEVEHTVVDPSFISDDLLAALDKSPALKVTFESEISATSVEDPQLSEELRELDFYINNGLEEDASAMLAELRAVHGDHPALLERLASLEET